jgi:hypothetical protein
MTRSQKVSLSFSLLFGALTAAFIASRPASVAPPVPRPSRHGVSARQAIPSGVTGFALRLSKKVDGKMSTITLTSTPVTFALTNVGNPVGNHKAVLFSIPSGVWTSGTWTLQGAAVAGHQERIGTTGGNVLYPAEPPNASVDETIAVSAAQLTDINAAAGSTLSVTVSETQGGLAASSFTLELTGTLAADHCSITPSLQETVVGNVLTYTITIYDSLSNPTPAPVGGQVFTVRDNGGGGTLGT